MSKQLYEIKGFKELKRKIQALPDKVKRREMVKILRLTARSTVLAARVEAPKSTKAHMLRGGKVIQPGNLKKSIKVETLRRSKVPMVAVGPKSSGKHDGFYGRQFVIPGHRTRAGNFVKPNNFMERGFDRTKGLVSAEMVQRTEKLVQRQIDRL